ncbi:M13 family metallopeptidase [Chryseolinea lacunae]|uniref:M13 family metallopeptidase n=1 Tax=Chryseolinea lacunae TaxID=2801331 RepID=A0ABS1KW07_9BACT|nr:M13 family metallopeptidase [Chryseolinea lacunae]MBL0743498.1 M13 family metallopeptidase [Chryseolinea lacunae]
MKKLALAVLAGVAMSAVSCSSDKKKDEAVVDVGLNLSYVDTTVRPQDDFFKYVNGGWIGKTNIPADQGRWGSFNELREFNNDVVLKVLKKAGEDAKLYPEGTDQRKAADFYSIGMDSALAEHVGVGPIKPLLAKIEAVKSKNDIQTYLVEDVMTGGGAFFGFGILPDLKNSKKMAAYLGSGGLGLPERDYYLNTDPKSVETRAKYEEHLATLFKLSGEDEAKAKANGALVLKLETQLAKSMLSKEDRRNPVKQYNPKSLKDLAKLTPSVNWPAYFEGLKVKEDTIIVSEPAFLQEYEKVVNSYTIDQVKTYLKAALLRGAAPFLSHDFVEASFDFNTRYMRGTDKMRPRWKRVLDVTDSYLGEAIGKLYVDDAFPPEAKQKALEMVENIKLAFADRIKSLDWMSDSTKQRALHKLSTFTVKIGYPDKWKDYSGLAIEKAPEKASYFGNVLSAARFQVQHEIEKLGKPVDKTEWEMTPQTVNAYYNPLFNEIVFPAGILQPPFYNYRADEAVNYGGIGAVIGHEISHGFDDQGSQFDADGNLKNWWASTDLTKFQEKGGAYAGQFDKYEPLKGVFVQGKFTLGENIGDLGGLAVAYEGLQLYLKNHGRPELIGGLTPEQRFFMSWGTIWRVKYRDESLRTQVLTDPHSPGMYRANGPLSNFDPFYKTFDVKEGDKMFRPESERVKIW